jgi:hypothetical protein
MALFHNALDELQQRLNDAEREKSKWQLVDDLLVENLPDEVDHCKVSIFTDVAVISRDLSA